MKFLHGYIFFCIVLTSVFACKQKEADCSTFKTGKFVYVDSVENKLYYIERNDSMQIETDALTGKVAKSKVIWVNPCEYNLTASSYTGVPGKKLSKLEPINVKIIKTAPGYYIFTAHITKGQKEITVTDTMRLK